MQHTYASWAALASGCRYIVINCMGQRYSKRSTIMSDLYVAHLSPFGFVLNVLYQHVFYPSNNAIYAGTAGMYLSLHPR